MSEYTIDNVQLALADALPEDVRWMVTGTPLDFDFRRSREPLKPVTGSDLDGDLEDLAPFLVFGTRDYAEGGGSFVFLTLHRETLRVYGIDVEREPVIFLLNSNIERFLRTFKVFDSAIRLAVVDLNSLASLALDADPEVYADSEWSALTECLLSE